MHRQSRLHKDRMNTLGTPARRIRTSLCAAAQNMVSPLTEATWIAAEIHSSSSKLTDFAIPATAQVHQVRQAIGSGAYDS